MTYYPDLRECRYFARPEWSFVDKGRVVTEPAFDPSARGRLIAIGWLEDKLPTQSVDSGALSAAVDALLRIHAAHVDPWPSSMGRHGCGLCGMPPDAPVTEVVRDGQRFKLGAGFITVPGSGFLYVAPSLIVHYILAHGYRPPSEFLAALERCPHPHAPAYIDALRREGPPGIIYDREDE